MRQEDTAKKRLGWADPVAVNRATGRIVCCTLEEDVARAIRVILTTRQGERVMHPTFGSNLHLFLFEVDDISVRAKIAAEAKRALAVWEPRITDVEAEVQASTGQAQGFLILLRYTIRETGQQAQETYTFEG